MKYAATATTTITFQVCHFAQQYLTTITTRHAATPTHIAWCNASTGRTIRYIINKRQRKRFKVAAAGRQQ
jgi:hypothetical protein